MLSVRKRNNWICRFSVESAVSALQYGFPPRRPAKSGTTGSHQLSFPVNICQYITQSALNDHHGFPNVAGLFFSYT